MATTSILVPTSTAADMASRRVPLANVQNAINSPFRNVAAVSGKRTRAQAGDGPHGQPALKKQIIEISEGTEENVDPRRRNGVAVSTHDEQDEPFAKRSKTQPTAFERKLASVREKQPIAQQQPKERVTKANGDNLDSIRQWQRHYRRQFPQFVIYFDGVPDDVRLKTVRQVQSLHAREEKFFSKAVTHVVTTRPIPPELTNTSPEDEDKANATQQRPTPAPSQEQRKGASLLDAAVQRRTQTQAAVASHDVDPRRAPGPASDILSRARQLGIKIWALEKLQRMLTTILDADAGDQTTTHDTRSHVSNGRTASKPAKDADLEQLLRNEKVNGPADRDLTVAAPDVTAFRGYFLYIHDMDEKTKPVMVRDYPKPTHKEQGKWPQFRLTGPGRCPFIEDPAHAKKMQQQEAAARAQEEVTAQRKTRAVSAQQAASTRTVLPPRALTERQANLRRSPRKLDTLHKPLYPPKGLTSQCQSSTEGMPTLFGSAQQSSRGLPRMIGGEPMASGMQHSNVTSAIRSQYISSAAISSTAPGANYRVSDSKEVSALKRKVLERGATVTSQHSMPSSYMNDMRAAINIDNDPPPRAAKRKAQETLGVVHECDDTGREKLSKPAPRKRKPVEKDPKPGYCENCRDKFENFDDVSMNLRKILTEHN